MIDVRSIQKSLGGLYSGKIDNDWGPLTQSALDAKQRAAGIVVPPWLVLAEKEMGITEIAGARANARIVEYHKCTSLQATSDEVAWCSAFVNFIMKMSGNERTNSAAARSWLNFGTPIKIPRYGSIVIFWRGSPTSWEGHVGFVVAEDHDSVAVLGGNQSNKVRVSIYKKSEVLGYRWP
jgi:uncharacterized protein (TIGR02594 family)